MAQPNSPNKAPAPAPAPKVDVKEEDDAEVTRLLQEEEDAKTAAREALAKSALDRKTAEDAAKSAALAAAEAAKVSNVVRAPTPVAKRAGDIKVVCLKDQTVVRLGNRSYVFKAGEEISMNPDHAEEMESAGWVVRRSR